MSGTKFGGLTYTTAHNGHNGRCGQFFTYFVDIMDEITLYGHNGQLEYLTESVTVENSDYCNM